LIFVPVDHVAKKEPRKTRGQANHPQA
jgi:hypothetical protein